MTDPGAMGRETGRAARTDVVGSLAVVLAAACWGTSGIFVKLIANSIEVSALALAFWRDLTTFAVLFAGIALLRPTWLRVRRSDLPWLVGMGTSLGIFHVFWNLGVFLNGAAVATVQQAAMPAIVTVAAWFLWREALTCRKIVAIVLTFAGTVLVSGLCAQARSAGLDVLGQAELSLLGLLVGFGIPIMYASWTLFAKKNRETHNPFTTLLYAFAFGALVLLPFQFFTPQPWPVTGEAVAWFGGLILISTILAFSLYTFALGRIPASVASILAMSEIAFVAVYAYVLLGERLSPSQIVGTLLVVGGVLLLSGWKQKKDKRSRTDDELRIA